MLFNKKQKEIIETPEDLQKHGGHSLKDIRHNMKVVIMLDALFLTAAADLGIALQPLLIFLQTPKWMMGLISFPFAFALVGNFLSPYISRKFHYKKLYLLIANMPYIGAIGVIGFIITTSKSFGINEELLLKLVFFMMMFHGLAAGFCTLPHQEYVAGCIPMSHRARFSGYSLCVGSLASLLSGSIGYMVLDRVAEPRSFGILLLMFYGIAQSGYFLALLGREKPVPVEKAPPAWSKKMFNAFIQDKAFIKVLVLYGLLNLFLQSTTYFVNAYGLEVLKMPSKVSAVFMIISMVIRTIFAPASGFLADKIGAKKLFTFSFLLLGLGFIPILLFRNESIMQITLPIIKLNLPFVKDTLTLLKPISVPINWMSVYLSVALYNLGIIVYSVSCTTLAYGIPKPENRSGHYTIQIIFGSIIITVGNTFMGAAIDVFGYFKIFTFAAVFGIIMYPVAVTLLKSLSDKAEDYS